jgi:protein-S-isoprenylcysteine O-methyltransferase Ste14
MISQWIIFFVSLTIGLTLSSLKIGISGDPILFKSAGTAILLIGFVIRWIGIFQLGKMFTVDVSISSSHTLKTDGLYKIVRHPTYCGLILIIFGLSLLMNNVLSIFVIMIPSFCVIYYRITVEEKALIQEFGDEYLLYKKKVKMIIPFLY